LHRVVIAAIAIGRARCSGRSLDTVDGEISSKAGNVTAMELRVR